MVVSHHVGPGRYESFQSHWQDFWTIKYTQVFSEKWNEIFRITVRNKQKG